MSVSTERLSAAWKKLCDLPCTSSMLVAIWLMFGVELIAHAPGNTVTLAKLGALTAAGVARGEYWRLLSYALLHSGWWHIGLNTILLLIAGPVVEQALGARSTLIISLLGAVLGGVAILFVHHGDPALLEVGASGAFFALLGAALGAAWQGRAMDASRIYRRLRTVLVIGVAISFVPGVSMAAHLAGLVVGGVYAWARRY